MAILFNQQSTSEDLVWWVGTASGIYSSKSTFHWLLVREKEVSVDSWFWIWKLRVPEKMKLFIWKISHNALPTNSTIFHYGAMVCGILII
jgi:hypothetical protein